MWIMISGPYTSGARTPEERAANLREMNRAAAGVFALGHIPLIGVNLALPVIEAAGDDAFDRIMMPLSLALAERCDACLRIGGSSRGADEEAERFRKKGKPVYHSLDELPAPGPEERVGFNSRQGLAHVCEL